MGDCKPKIYNLNSLSKTDRIDSLLKTFEEHFSLKPDACIKMPGRVNLIGEHIDYCGYGVFPMAIKQDIMVALLPRDDGQLFLRNVSPEYENFTCDINNFEICSSKPSWYNYFLCGVRGIKDKCDPSLTLKGLSVVVSGCIPPSAGLSSSSALVCAAALAITHTQKLSFTLKELAEVCAVSERYIGTLGGGMDQATIFLSTSGFAQMIEFNPLKSTLVRLPDKACFVIANSLSEKNKAASSDYNCRVVECRLACRILALKTHVDVACKTLGELQIKANKSLSEMIELVKESLHPGAYTKDELCNILSLSESELDKQILSKNTQHITEFHLFKRAFHVFSEANRVLLFKEVCKNWLASEKAESDTMSSLKELGELMNASHTSLRDFYECSHPSLDRLVKMSQEFALGVRLTGAGWGGCIVALVMEHRLQDYIDHLSKNYYLKEKLIDSSKIGNAIFSTEPSEGACIYIL